MKDAVSFLLEHCSRSRVKKFLDRFGVEAESVELNANRIEWRSSIESLIPEVLGLLEETAEKIVMLASEPNLGSMQWASFICDDVVWDVCFMPETSNVERILDVWLTYRVMFYSALRIRTRRATPPSLVTPEMA